MMLDANDGGATVTALPVVADLNRAWTDYATMMKRAVADPGLLVDRNFCVALSRAWTVFRDQMGAAQ